MWLAFCTSAYILFLEFCGGRRNHKTTSRIDNYSLNKNMGREESTTVKKNGENHFEMKKKYVNLS